MEGHDCLPDPYPKRAGLTRLQIICVTDWLDKIPLKETAKFLNVSYQTVQKHRDYALDKLRRLPKDYMESREVLSWMNKVRRYRKPTSTGAGLARLDLKLCRRPGGCCSVTRPMSVI